MKLSPNGGLRSSGVVKWFDVGKGFGFLEVDGMRDEVLLHVSVLRDYGLSSVSKGSTVEFDYEVTPKGVRVTNILSVSRDRKIVRSGDLSAQEIKALEPAAVKWFDASRGFGFVTIFWTNREVFLHSAVLQVSEVEDVFPGLAVAVLIETDGKRSQVKHLFSWVNAGDPSITLGSEGECP